MTPAKHQEPELVQEVPGWVFVALKYGVGSLIALYLVWWGTASFGADLKDVKDTLHEHVQRTDHTNRQTCIAVNYLAGMPAALCDPGGK